MDFWRTVLVVFRRWYVTVPAFLLAVGIALMVYSMVPVRYVSTAALVLTAPPTGGSLVPLPDHQQVVTNPLLNFDHGLSTSATILIQALGTPELATELGAPPGGSTTYRVTNGSSNPELLTSGPFVFIAGEGATSAQAQDIVRRVIDRAKLELAARQRELDAPEPTYITITEVVSPTTPEAQGGSRMRAAAAALALGVIASLAAGFAMESLAAAWRSRRSRGRDTEAGEAADHTPVLVAGR
jgi:hypothetical protein